MKKKFVLPSFIALISMSLVGTIAGSLAWLSDKANIATNSKVGGSSEGAYFAYGNGTAVDDPSTPVKEGPYGIETARQLYNLAWLQYLGRFNKVEDNVITPKYFELNADIDMTGWVIPPIGTSLYPFIGEFNGQGHKITNLVTSNDFDQILDTNKIPGRIKKDGSISDVNIVGMFGVVGNLNNAIPQSVTYDSSVTSIKDFNLNNASITSTASNTLVGIVAGYVNGPISGVGVQSSAINEKSWTDRNNVVHNIGAVNKLGAVGSETFNNISDFGIVGFCEDQYKSLIKTTNTQVFNTIQSNTDVIIDDKGEEGGWGGSIDMKTMYSDIRTVWDTFSTSSDNIYSYPTTRTIVEDVEGQVVSDVYGGYTKNSQQVRFGESSTETVQYYGYEQKNAQSETTSSYTLAHRSGSNSFMYLYGHTTKTVQNALTTTRTYYTTDTNTFYLVDAVSSPSHYLSIVNEEVSDATSSANATQWNLDTENRLRTWKIVNDERQYSYLASDNGIDLKISNNEDEAIQWIVDASNNSFYVQIGVTQYYLTYQSGWKIVAYTPEYFYISIGTSYVRNSSGTLSISTASNATKWYLDEEGYVSDQNGYYLGYSVTTNWQGRPNGVQLSVSTNPSKKLTYFDDQLSCTERIFVSSWGGGSYRNITYYFAIVSGWYSDEWGLTETETTLTCTFGPTANYHIYQKASPGLPKKTTEESKDNSTYITKHTYFPLRQENHDGVPKDTNTGYVSCGIGNETTMGQIRVSEYSSSSLSTKLNTVRTINASGTVTIDSTLANKFVKYKASKDSLQGVFDDDTAHIYGLHFMNGDITYGGNGVSAIVPSATINGETHSNYELPTNCIDFNLKEQGYINFFAGTYYSGNNSFFSLYEVQRNSSQKIIDVLRITEVLSDGIEGHSYSYKYSNNQYSVPFKFNDMGQKVNLDGTAYSKYSTAGSAPTGYSTVFRSSWIEVNSLTDNAAYYFEIPMNDGEYALGSVSGGTGAYLMYLDIGANAKKFHRSSIKEYFKLITGTTSYACGVGFIAAGSTASDMNSFCVTIKETYNGLLSFNRASDSVATYVDSSGSANVELVYRYGGVAVNPNAQGVSEEPTYETSVKEIIRLTYYDFDPNNNTTTKIVITDVFVDGTREGTRTVQKWSKWDFTNETGTLDENVIIYDADGKKVTNINTIDVNKTGCNSTIFSFGNYYPNIGVITIDFLLDGSKVVSDQTTVAKINGYIITVTLTRSSGSENITSLCKIINKGDGTYTFTINGTAITENGQEITIEVSTGS